MNALSFLDNVRSTQKPEANTIVQVNEQLIQATIGGHNFDIDLTLSQDQIIKNVADVLCQPKHDFINHWLYCSFGQVAMQSKPKASMFKLLEFNKMELVDNNSFLSSNTELESKLISFFCHESKDESKVDTEELKELHQ